MHAIGHQMESKNHFPPLFTTFLHCIRNFLTDKGFFRFFFNEINDLETHFGADIEQKYQRNEALSAMTQCDGLNHLERPQHEKKGLTTW